MTDLEQKATIAELEETRDLNFVSEEFTLNGKPGKVIRYDPIMAKNRILTKISNWLLQSSFS